MGDSDLIEWYAKYKKSMNVSNNWIHSTSIYNPKNMPTLSKYLQQKPIEWLPSEVERIRKIKNKQAKLKANKELKLRLKTQILE